MNSLKISKTFKELPENRQKIALEFVESLKRSHKRRQLREEIEERRGEERRGEERRGEKRRSKAWRDYIP